MSDNIAWKEWMPKIALGVTAITASSYLLYRYTRTAEAVPEPEKEVPIVKSALSRTKTKVLKAKFSDYHKHESVKFEIPVMADITIDTNLLLPEVKPAF